MFVTSSNLNALLWLLSRLVLALFNGFPYPHSAHVASHFVVSIPSPVYLLKRCSFFICVWRFSRFLVVMMLSLAYPWSSYVMYVLVGDRGWCVGLYHVLPMEGHLSNGSKNIVNRKGERVLPCSVSLWMGITENRMVTLIMKHCDYTVVL